MNELKIIALISIALFSILFINQASAITTTDTLYACTAPFGNPEIHLINKTTGVSISNQTITVAGLTVLGCNGLAVDPTTGTFYAIIKEQVSPSNRHLITLDPVTGIGTDLGATGDSMASLNFLANGSLRTITGFNSGTPEKYTALDKTNAQATGLCTLSTGAGQGQGLALNFDDGKIYHVNTFNDGLTTVDNETVDPCSKTNSAMSGFNYGEMQSFTYNTNDGLFYVWSFINWVKMTSSGVVTFLSQNPSVPESPFYIHQDSSPSDVNLTVGDFNGEILDGTLTIPTVTPEISKLTTKLKSTGGATGTIVGQIINNFTTAVVRTSNNSIDASTLTGSYQDFTFTFLVYGTIDTSDFTIVGVRFLSGSGTIQSAIVSPPIASVEGSNLRIDPILNIQVNEDLEGIIFQKPVSTSPTQVSFKGLAFDLLLAIDTINPVISTLVPEPIPIPQNSVFDEFEFVSCIDDTDGDITNTMSTVGTVDTSTPRTYFVDYTCTDNASNQSQLEVKYIVKRSPTGSGGTAPSAPTVGGVTTAPTISTTPPLSLVPSEPREPPTRTLDEIFDLFASLFEEAEPIPTLEVVPESVTDIPAPLFEPAVEPTERPSFIESIQNFFSSLFGFLFGVQYAFAFTEQNFTTGFTASSFDGGITNTGGDLTCPVFSPIIDYFIISSMEIRIPDVAISFGICERSFAEFDISSISNFTNIVNSIELKLDITDEGLNTRVCDFNSMEVQTSLASGVPTTAVTDAFRLSIHDDIADGTTFLTGVGLPFCDDPPFSVGNVIDLGSFAVTDMNDAFEINQLWWGIGIKFTDETRPALVGCTGTFPFTSCNIRIVHDNPQIRINYTTITDNEIPVITITGDNPASVLIDTFYGDEGATAIDDFDVDSANIVSVSNVDTSTLGTFQVTYNVNDRVGNSAIEAVRTVNVVELGATIIGGGGSGERTTTAGGVTQSVPSLSDIPPISVVPTEPTKPPTRTLDEVFDLFSFLFEEVEPIPTLEVVPESVTEIPPPLSQPPTPAEIRPSFIESIQNFFAGLFG